MLGAMAAEMISGHAPLAVLLCGTVMFSAAAVAAVSVRRGRGGEAAAVDALAMLVTVFLPAFAGGGHHGTATLPIVVPAVAVLCAWALARRALAPRRATTVVGRAVDALAGALVTAMLVMQVWPH